MIVRPYFQFSQVSGRQVFEEGVHVLHRIEPVVAARDDGEVEVVESTSLEGAVQRPFGEGDPEERLARLCGRRA